MVLRFGNMSCSSKLAPQCHSFNARDFSGASTFVENVDDGADTALMNAIEATLGSEPHKRVVRITTL